jgi:hypothetical protein
MKLKFDNDLQNVINDISNLPDTTTDVDVLNVPVNMVAAFETLIQNKKDKKLLPVKQWVILRRQISFLFELLRAAQTAAEIDPTRPSNLITQEKKEAFYKFFVKGIKDLKTGKAIKNVVFVRMGLRYGIIRLSDHEIQKLIDNNKID